MRRRFQVLLADLLLLPSPLLYLAAIRVVRESARDAVFSLDDMVITVVWFTGVLAGWIRGISSAVPQDLKGNSCFAVSQKRVGFGCGGSEKKRKEIPLFS